MKTDQIGPPARVGDYLVRVCGGGSYLLAEAVHVDFARAHRLNQAKRLRMYRDRMEVAPASDLWSTAIPIGILETLLRLTRSL